MTINNLSDKIISYHYEKYDHYHWFRIASGYKDAAVILIKYLLKNEIKFYDHYLVFPVMYNIRHFMELLMKQIIIEYNGLADDNIKIPRGHNLNKLFDIVLPIIDKIMFKWYKPFEERLKSTFSQNDIIILQEIVELINKYDKKGTTFRFPIDISGNQEIKEGFQIPLQSLNLKVHEIFSILHHVLFTMDLIAAKVDQIDNDSFIEL